MDLIFELISAILIGFTAMFFIGVISYFFKLTKKSKIEDVEKLNTKYLAIRFEEVEQKGYRTVLVFDIVKNSFLCQAATVEEATQLVIGKFLNKEIVVVSDTDAASLLKRTTTQ